jgi:hypothetical protein
VIDAVEFEAPPFLAGQAPALSLRHGEAGVSGAPGEAPANRPKRA